MNPFIYYTMCRRAKILFYFKLPRIGIYSIQLTPQIMSEPFQIWFRHVRNNLFTGIGKTLHCMPDSAYRHSVELHQMVRNGYSVSIRWVVKTVQCSLPMWCGHSFLTRLYPSQYECFPLVVEFHTNELSPGGAINNTLTVDTFLS